MPFYEFLLSVASMLAGGLIGWRMAAKRGRNPVGWMVAGVLFPPLVLALFFMKPASPAIPADGSESDPTEGAAR
ncbi:MAG: hypothetical protein JNM81_10750 [Rhodospirillaceae bacterium]|nr:hypothetical protein [Rhodospirillaceae bacterium]